MAKRKKVRGQKYTIGCHPIKASVNQWLRNVTRQVIHSENPWALLLESEATLTIQSLTQQSSLHLETEKDKNELFGDLQSSNNLGPLFKQRNIIIPQPDLDQINKIHDSCPQVKLFPLTSHELLSDISSFEANENTTHSSSSLIMDPSNKSTSLINIQGDASETKTNFQTSSKPSKNRDSLISEGWLGWFDLVWLDYCGKVSSGSAGKLRKMDLEMLFKSGMLAGGRRGLGPPPKEDSCLNKLPMSVLAVTMCKRATPLR